MPWPVILLIVVALLTVPFIFGGYVARKFRMPDYGWKIGLVLCTLACGIVINVFAWPPKLGADLSGGVVLVYEVDQDKKTEDKKLTGNEMERLIAAVSRRVNPGGVKDVTIRQYGVEQIEIIIPYVDEDEAKRIESDVSRAGTLEFRILANTRDHKPLIARAKAENTKIIKDSEGNELGRWVPVDPGQVASFDYPEIARRTRRVGENEITEILVVKDEFDVTGGYLTQSTPGVDRRGQPCVNFTFNSAGGHLFRRLTSSNLPDKVQNFTRKLGIILDGSLYSAPAIQDVISNRGEISGSFTNEEVKSLVNVLNAGALPTALAKEPISRRMTGPTLGRDTIVRGSYAITASMIIVLLFMLFYYRFCGIIACLALIMNLVLILAVMITVKSAFTLYGIAGLVLTIGMSVDANVLIFERIREEMDRGAALRMAIRNGFGRATTAIVDANVTTLIVATVLWTIGTEQLKGFAVILWLGVVMSMYTAIFCSRVVFDIAERRRWITKLRMMRIIGKTDIDFVGMRRLAAAVSLLVIVVGLAGVTARGIGLLDIDFTGGVSVEVLFKKPQNIAEIREKLSGLPDLAVSNVQIQSEPENIRFVINTSQQEIRDENETKKIKHTAIGYVEKHLHDVFLDKLDSNSFTMTEPVEIKQAGSETKESAAEKPAGETPTEPNHVDPFVGGSLIKLTFDQKVGHDTLEEMFAVHYGSPAAVPLLELSNPGYQEGGSTSYKTWDVKVALAPDEAKTTLESIKTTLENTPLFPSSNLIGGKVAGSMRTLAVTALMVSLLCIVGYLWIRFQRAAFGLAAVIALVHDVLITLGAIALSAYIAPYLGVLLVDPFKISLAVLAAFLTIIGYSLNDTIVVFDRIREVRGKAPHLTGDMINTSINQTLSRTLLTSLTTLIVVVILYVFGGQGIHAFAFALVIGVLVGTYSSVFVASPVLLWMSRSKS